MIYFFEFLPFWLHIKIFHTKLKLRNDVTEKFSSARGCDKFKITYLLTLSKKKNYKYNY